MDKETFTRQALAQQRTLYRIALSYTASVADAEDAVQEALLRAWDKRHTLREEAYFGTWLTRILINEWNVICQGQIYLKSKPPAKPVVYTVPSRH